MSLPPRLELEFVCGMMHCKCKSTYTVGVSLATVVMWNSLENICSPLCVLSRVSSPVHTEFRARVHVLFRSCANHYHFVGAKGNGFLDSVVVFLCFDMQIIADVLLTSMFEQSPVHSHELGIWHLWNVLIPNICLLVSGVVMWNLWCLFCKDIPTWMSPEHRVYVFAYPSTLNT